MLSNRAFNFPASELAVNEGETVSEMRCCSLILPREERTGLKGLCLLVGRGRGIHV